MRFPRQGLGNPPDMAESDLSEYEEKRNFDRTSEPSSKTTRLKRKGGKPAFVIQKHEASSLHYDFRIEVEGALRSWAVPKGLSTDPKEKRLAMPTEDHPMGYLDFEGNIAKEEYGGGSVIVWDTGTYRNITEDRSGKEIPIEKALDDGHAAVWLEGEKLRGGYTLQRTGGGERPRWLVIKRKDKEADARRNPVSSQPESVLSGRTVEEVAAEADEG
jgi:DNA ligase D-like protein (predicted 3'-phosphoesterase)